MASTVSELITLGSGGLSIILSRVADRYRHEVVVTTDETHVVLTSLEGANDQVWPPSPPFQELHLHQPREGINAALLVGRAGRSHWSASIEFDASREAVLFDIACRSSGDIEWLGSRYQSLVRPSLATATEGRTLFFAYDLQVHVLDGEACMSAEGSTDVLSIAPKWTVASTAQTIRWRYRVSRASSPVTG